MSHSGALFNQLVFLIPTVQTLDSCQDVPETLKSGKPDSSRFPAEFQLPKTKPFQRLCPESGAAAIFASFHPEKAPPVRDQGRWYKVALGRGFCVCAVVLRPPDPV